MQCFRTSHRFSFSHVVSVLWVAQMVTNDRIFIIFLMEICHMSYGSLCCSMISAEPRALAVKCCQIFLLQFNPLAVCFGNVFVVIIESAEQNVWTYLRSQSRYSLSQHKLVWPWRDATSHSEKGKCRERLLIQITALIWFTISLENTCGATMSGHTQAYQLTLLKKWFCVEIPDCEVEWLKYRHALCSSSLLWASITSNAKVLEHLRGARCFLRERDSEFETLTSIEGPNPGRSLDGEYSKTNQSTTAIILWQSTK